MSHVQQRTYIFLALQSLRELWLFLNRLGNRDVRTWFVRYQLGDAVTEAVGKIHDATDITNRRTRSHGAERHDLTDRIATVFFFDVLNDAVPIGLAEVNIEVGHRDPLGIQKSLEKQVELQRV